MSPVSARAPDPDPEKIRTGSGALALSGDATSDKKSIKTKKVSFDSI